MRMKYTSANPLEFITYENENLIEKDNEQVIEYANMIRQISSQFSIPLGECEIINASQIYKFNFVVKTIQGATKLPNKLKAIANTCDIMLQINGTRAEIKNGLTVEIPKTNRMVRGIKYTLLSKYEDYSLPCSLGFDTDNEPLVIDLAKAPHLLIAGSTGSGKSVLVNDIIMSLITYRAPFDMQLVLIDPKQVEFSIYENLPHLAEPIVTSTYSALQTLSNAVDEMENRYRIMAQNGYRSLEECTDLFPRLVIVIDELSNLIEFSKGDTELLIETLLAKGRACGIHLIVATQNPTRKVITGRIKANIPSVVALTTASITDSKVILDYGGAEKLQGKGDALYKSPTEIGFKRFQSAYISTEEIKHQLQNWVKYVRVNENGEELS